MDSHSVAISAPVDAGVAGRWSCSPRGPLRHLGKLGCVRSDPYEPTSTGIGVGRGGAATHLYATDLYSDLLDRSYSILAECPLLYSPCHAIGGFDLVRIARCRWFDSGTTRAFYVFESLTMLCGR